MKKLVCAVIASLSLSVFAKSALDYYNEALSLQNQRQWFEATDLYREALDINPQFGDAWYNLAKCSYALGSFDLAVEYADKAAKYSRNLSDIQNLKGISLIALGKVSEARKVFESVLKKYPNDVDARFGLAELDLLDGKITVAESRYKDALKRDNTNKKALLSLALVSSEMGRNDAAMHYINQALNNYSGESEVHYMAAFLAAKAGDYKTAEQRVRSAVQINTNFDKAYSLLSVILYAQGRFEDVVDLCDFRIGRNRQLADAWYLKGLSEQKLNRLEDALETFNTGLSVNPQDEVMRNALEQLADQILSIEDPRRLAWASYHSKKAAEYGRNFQGVSERYEYQKALSVAPLDFATRQGFADMLDRDGLHELYVQQIEFIKENDPTWKTGKDRTRQQIKNDDSLEAYKSLMANNISSRWNVDPFYLDKTRWNIGIYYTKVPVQLIHADLEEVSAKAAKVVFNGVPSTYVDIHTSPVDSFGQAFRIARAEKRDYFIIMTAKETERTYSLDATIYSARTGTKTSEIHVYRTGNDRMAKALQRFRSGVLDILPIRGKVLRNVQGKLLLDIGKNDGVLKDAEFAVVRKGAVVTNDSGPGVTYHKKDLLGTVKITDTNEEISEGQYEKHGFYDTLNVEDEIILISNPETKGKNKEGSAPQDIRPAADNNGKPATEAARKAQKEAIEESLKPVNRENDLITLIRSII